MTRVLLLEPDDILANLYKSALREGGHQVKYKKSAQAAVHSIDVFQPDVIVMEMQIAEHNGLEFLYELRSYSEWQTTPVILMTIVPLSDMANNLKAFGQLGVVDYLYKPTTKLVHLVRAVERFAPVSK